MAAILFSVYTGVRLSDTDDWEIVADKKRCLGGGISKGKLSLQECASTCADVSVYFSHGTNDYGQDKCTGQAICDCICESGETCNKIMNMGFRLYRKKQIGEYTLRSETQ